MSKSDSDAVGQEKTVKVSCCENIINLLALFLNSLYPNRILGECSRFLRKDRSEQPDRYDMRYKEVRCHFSVFLFEQMFRHHFWFCVFTLIY